MRFPIALDRRHHTALHRQVYDQLRRAILAGRLAAGDRVASTRDLAGELRLSRATVAVAYDQLVAEGYLESRLGAGTFVCRELPDQPLPQRRTAASRGEDTAVRLSALVSRLAPSMVRRPAPPGVIDLSAPAPDGTLFPFAIWHRLLRRQLRRGPSGGALDRPDGAGLERLRQAIAAYLGRSRAVLCRADQVLIVSGSQQALDLCTRALVDPGDHVAIEEPGYPEGRHLFTAARAIVHPVPVDGDGLMVAQIPPSVRLTFVTPSHQYPTGVSLSLARRLELLDWARTCRGVILEDDYDSEFRYGGAPLPSLQGLGDASRVVYAGTFSTAMFWGLRLGYLVLPAALVEPFVQAKRHASGHTASLEQAVLADFIREGHLERHLRRMRRVYKRRREALVDAVTRQLGDRATIVGDAAGLHAVVRLTGRDVVARARQAGVALESTAVCYAGTAPANEVLVRFAGVPERMLREGIRRIAALRP